MSTNLIQNLKRRRMKGVRKIVFVDLDNTLVRTHEFGLVFQASVREVCGEEKHIEMLDAYIAWRVHDDMVRPASIFSDDEWRNITALIRRKALTPQGGGLNEHYLFDGVPEFIAALQNTPDTGAVILTYGEERWQMLKYDLIGLNVLPIIVTEKSDKAALIKEFFDGEQYKANDLVAPEIVLIDDKPESFASFGQLKNARGYAVHHGVKTPDYSMLPAEVRIVHDIRDATF